MQMIRKEGKIMFKDKFLQVKDKLKDKSEGNNKKLIENLVFFVILLIITIVGINYIWFGKSKMKGKEDEDLTNTKILATEDIDNGLSTNSDNMEAKLENILSNIKGVGKVYVLITYSRTSKLVPIYNEDQTQTTTQESDSGGGTRTVTENSSKKEVIYEENDGSKTAMTQSIESPIIEGAVITAQGAENAEIKANIIQAVEAATGLATHKIQVFEMD